MVAVGKNQPSVDTSTLLSEVASFASTLGFSSAAGDSSGFNDTDFRKAGPIKPASQPSSSSQKNKPAKKFNGKKQERNADGNRNGFQGSKVEPKKREPKSDSVAEIVDESVKNLPKLPLVSCSKLGAWHRDAAELEEKVLGKNRNIEFSNVEEWKAFAEKKKELGQRLMAQYVQDYWSSRGQHSDIKMLVSTQRTGTAADKVSALSVLIGDNPVANLRAIDSMLGMVTSKVGKRHAFTAFGSLKGIMIILLPDRKLKFLIQRPLNHLPENKDGYSLLLFWYWEECLKDRYEQFISALEGASLDVVVELKNLSLKTIYILLKSKPEQERRLLSSLVNKLGDPENKVASNADYHLSNLLSEHPNMKAVVLDEVDHFLFRPHLGFRAKYHAVNFLSQIHLSHKGDGQKAAKRLIDIYFALFKVLMSECGPARPVEKNQKRRPSSLEEDKLKENSGSHFEMDSRLFSAILTGVNRAFPYLQSDEADEAVQVQTPLLFQMVHSKNFNIGVQALMLLDKISSKNKVVSDRFYRALYSKLLMPSAMISSKEEMFIALILRAMKNDVNIRRVAAFAKRLLQVSLQLPPQHACGFLFLLSEVHKTRPPLWNMVLQSGAAAVEDEGLEHFVDIPDSDDKLASPAMDSEQNKAGVGVTDNDADDGSSSDEASVASSDSESCGFSEDEDLLGKAGLVKFEETNSVIDKKTQHLPTPVSNSTYNLRHRDPSYCNADRVGWWELSVLASHVHPSVSAMAKTLLSGANILYNGNPLCDLSLPAFLDKFMEKKPKQNVWHGASQIEPARKIDTMNHQLIGAEILSLGEEDVPPEDVVFHKFYMNKMNSSKKPKKKKKKKTEDEEAAEELYAVNGNEDQSDEEAIDEEEIDDVLDNSAQSPEHIGEYDYDDMDMIATEDEDELIEDVSDPENEALSDEFSEEGDDIDDGLIVSEDISNKKKRKSGASPFASLEDYQHLIEEDEHPKSSKQNKKRKSKKAKSQNSDSE